jgi:hypothetical protein
MATFSFADMSASYPQLYRELRPQIQRKAPLLRVLNMKKAITGQNIGWDVTFSGQAAAVVNSDGGNLLTAASDPQVAATLGYGNYSAPVKVTTKAQWTGAAQNSADFLQNLIDRNMNEAINALVKKINQDIYAGAAGNALTGLSLAVAATGTYANIAQSSYSNWASTSQGNSGSLRSLTLALIKTQASTIASVSPHGRPDIAVCTPSVFNALENLFDGTVYTQAGKNDLVWGKVMTNGGLIAVSGFRTLAWMSAGITFIEDPDCTNTAVTNTANCMYFLNSQSVEMQFLPPADVSGYMPDQKVIQAVEQDLGPLANLQLDFRARGRSNFSDEFDILTMLNLVVKDRAACGILFDVQ